MILSSAPCKNAKCCLGSNGLAKKPVPDFLPESICLVWGWLFFSHVLSTPEAKLPCKGSHLEKIPFPERFKVALWKKCQMLVCVDFFFFSFVPEDTLMFWKGIADVGLMEEVVCNIQKEIEEVLRGVQQRLGQSPFQITGRL